MNRIRDAMCKSCNQAQCSPSFVIVIFVAVLVLLALKYREVVIRAAELTLIGICSLLFVWMLIEVTRLVGKIRQGNARAVPVPVAVSDDADSIASPAITPRPQPGSPEASEEAAIERARTTLAENKKEGTS